MPARETRSRAAGHPGPRRGFTLIEMLVVITIIAILAALTSVAVVRALDTAKQTRVKLEVDNLDLALKAYKEKYGSYPPCNLVFASGGVPNAQTIQHVARLFPRYNMGVGYVNLKNDLTQAGVDITYFRPDQALVFWLQGFSPDVANPFITPDGRRLVAGMPDPTKSTITPLFSFDPTRLYQVPSAFNGVAGAAISPTYPSTLMSPAPMASYFPQGPVPPSSSAAPYLYWDAGATTIATDAMGNTTVVSNYGNFSFTGPVQSAPLPVAFNLQNPSGTPPPPTLQMFPNAGLAVPYWNDTGVSPGNLEATENWVNPDSFQIISAGLDGVYGNPNTMGAFLGNITRLYPTGTNYDLSTNLADDDNITNFCNKARLGDAKP